jgi:hypothetical protein
LYVLTIKIRELVPLSEVDVVAVAPDQLTDRIATIVTDPTLELILLNIDG